MKQSLFLTVSIFLFAFLGQNAFAMDMIAIEYDEVVICPSQDNYSLPPAFNEPKCVKQHAHNINPQNTAIWVKARLNIPEEMQSDKKPYSVFISGKMSSKVFFNEQYIGQNGIPSHFAKEELPGKIDAMFYVPSHLIKSKGNELVLFLSSHHGFLELKRPVHFIGFSTYSDPTHFIQRNIWKLFIPLGALILSVVYFSVASFSPNHRKTNLLFLLMSILASSQLILELSRGLFSYNYPFHDIRLLLIVSLSVAFGICLLFYISYKFNLQESKKWIVTGFILTLICVVSFPGFDGKTSVAILIPSLVSMVIIGLQLKKGQTRENGASLAVFTLFTLTIIQNLASFHDLLFYFIIAGVLGFLFFQQALKLSSEQIKRKKEEQQVLKLQFRLDQNEQKIKPNKIKITSSGKVELISSNNIYYCKADGDYVGLHLKNNKELLYSGNLKELEKQLPSTFLRVHRSYLVNMDYIVSLKSVNSNNQKILSGSGVLNLDGDNQVPVSRRIMPMVRRVIN
jgi:hypothetical protein